jgi:16S rRNA C1402 N4-methylase RsmH
MRLNPQRGQLTSVLLKKITPDALTSLLAENADEPNARLLADALAGRRFSSTSTLAAAIRAALPRLAGDDRDLCLRRVF